MTTQMLPGITERPEHPDEAEFKVLLRDARIAAGYTHKALADLCGFSHQYINDIERGNRNPPGEEAVRRIALPLCLNSGETDYWVMCAEWARVPECWRAEVYRLRGTKPQGGE